MPPRSAKPRSAKKTAPLAQQENFDDDSEAKVISESETEKEKTLNASKNDKSKKKNPRWFLVLIENQSSYHLKGSICEYKHHLILQNGVKSMTEFCIFHFVKKRWCV